MPVREDEILQGEEKAHSGQTVTVQADAEDGLTDSYHPTKWQSNITILSCVSRETLGERHEQHCADGLHSVHRKL
jgi:hypothetical protein